MADPADNLTPKQHKAITALMSSKTIADAAEAANIGERTLYTWLDDPTFSAAYRAARREAVGQAVAQLQQLSGAAARELGQLVSGYGGVKPEIRLAAARTILEMAIKSVELDEVVARLDALEAAYAGKS